MHTYFIKPYLTITRTLNGAAPYLGLVLIRLILAWEFGEAGYEKFTGENWFSELSFPFPFNLLPPDISWYVAMSFELVGALALILGIATRFFSISLIILTVVAIASVHWPEHWSNIFELLKGYRIEDIDGDGFGNYKLPVIYLVMLISLVFSGAGKLSIDYLIKKYINKS